MYTLFVLIKTYKTLGRRIIYNHLNESTYTVSTCATYTDVSF